MRISDWSSDVCSSDLVATGGGGATGIAGGSAFTTGGAGAAGASAFTAGFSAGVGFTSRVAAAGVAACAAGFFSTGVEVTLAVALIGAGLTGGDGAFAPSCSAFAAFGAGLSAAFRALSGGVFAGGGRGVGGLALHAPPFSFFGSQITL